MNRYDFLVIHSIYMRTLRSQVLDLVRRVPGVRVQSDSKAETGLMPTSRHESVMKVLVAQPCLTLWDPVDCSHQAPLSMEFSRQEL